MSRDCVRCTIAVLVVLASLALSPAARALPNAAADPLAAVLTGSTPVPQPMTGKPPPTCGPTCRPANYTATATVSASSCGAVHVGLNTTLHQTADGFCFDNFGYASCNLHSPSYGACTQVSPGVYQGSASELYDCTVWFCQKI